MKNNVFCKFELKSSKGKIQFLFELAQTWTDSIPCVWFLGCKILLACPIGHKKTVAQTKEHVRLRNNKKHWLLFVII